MAFQMRFGEVVVKKCVVLQPRSFEFERGEVQNLFKDPKRLLFRQDACVDEIPNLQEKAVRFRPQGRLRAFDLALNQNELFVRREMRCQFGEGLPRLGQSLHESPAERSLVAKSFVKHNIVDLERIQGIGLGPQIGNAVFGGCIDDRIARRTEWNSCVVTFEQILVDAAFFIEDAKRGRQSAGKIFYGRAVEAFVIDAFDAKNDSEIAAFGKKDFVVHKPKEIYLRREGSSLAVLLGDLFQLKHGRTSTPGWARISLDRIACGPWRS